MRYRMRLKQSMGLTLAVAAMGASVSVNGQTAASAATAGADSGPRTFLTSPGLTSVTALLPDRLIRVIEDANLRDRWLLCRNVDHPGGPGRLLLVAAAAGGQAKRNPGGGAQSSGSFDSGQVAIRPVIRAGDRVVVEESSAVAEARLAAVALESATTGSAFNARLEIGGKVVRVVAVRTGWALLQPAAEVQR